MNIVQYRREMMQINTVVTSKEAILAVCREIAAESGIQTINMRIVAEKCHVAVGSIYNYFPSKADLITATIQNIWQDIFHLGTACRQANSFPDYVISIFDNVNSSAAAYPQFFAAHALTLTGTDKNKARETMESYFGHMKSGLFAALENDLLVSPTAFSTDFSKADFIDFVFSSLLSLLMRQESSCAIFIEMIRRTLYQPH